MHHAHLWEGGEPTPHTKLPAGMSIVFAAQDAEELAHLLAFLKYSLNISAKDFGATLDDDEERLPHVWGFNAKKKEWHRITLKRVAKEPEWLTGKVVAIGFFDHHLPLFRAYREHLEQDPAVDDELQEFFAEADMKHFGYDAGQ